MRTPRILLQAALAVVTLAAGIIGVGSIRSAMPPAQGDGLGSQLAPATRAQVRIATLNIHSGRGHSGKTDLTLTARTLEGFDLIGLQEVYNSLEPGTPPQTALLATASQVSLFAPTERQYWGQRFGNGLITSIPIGSWKTIALPAPKEHSRRNALIAHSGQITFLITHITRSTDQDEQLRVVEKLFLNQPAPAILMGDLNATSQHPLIHGLLDTPGVGNPLDEKMPQQAGKHIDWIFTRGMETRDAGTRNLGASDHPLVWAELAIAQPASSPTTQP